MGTAHNKTAGYQALLVNDERVGADTVAAKGVAATDSGYTQAGAFPGVPAPAQTTAMTLTAVGSQSEDGHLEILAQRPGHPGFEKAGLVFRDVAAGDTTAQYKGWDGPQVATAWTSLKYTAIGASATAVTDCVRLQNGTVLITGEGDTIAGSFDQTIHIYDPDTGTYTTSTAAQDGEPVAQGGPSILVLPNGTVLLFLMSSDLENVDVYASADSGLTWAGVGYSVLDIPVTVGGTIDSIRAAYGNGQISMVIAGTGGSLLQYASSDDGGSFQQVSAWLGPFDLGAVTALPSGGFLVAYHDPSGANYWYRTVRIGSATDDVGDGAIVTVTSGTTGTPGLGLTVDEDGIVYIFTNATTRNDLSVHRSLDEGATWEGFASTASEIYDSNNATTYLHSFSSCSVGGRFLIPTRWTAPTSPQGPESLAVLAVGGFGSHTVPMTLEAVGPLPNGGYRDVAYISYNDSGGNATPGVLYAPIELPDVIAGADTWVAAGAGTGVIASPQVLDITTVANTKTYTWSKIRPGITTAFAEFQVDVDAGDGAATTLAIAGKLRLSDTNGAGAVNFIYEVSIRVGDTSWGLWDEIAGTQVGASVVVSATSRIGIRVAIDPDTGVGGNIGNVRTWYSLGGHIQDWVPGPTGTTLNDDSGANPNNPSMVAMGSFVNSTVTSRWALVGACWWGHRWGPRDDLAIGESWTNPDSLHPFGSSILPRRIADGVMVAARSGPTFIGETWDIVADYTYPLAAIFPAVSPSPRRGWRSTADDIDVAIVFKLESLFAENLFDNATIGAFLFGSNLKQFKIQRWSGAAWVDVIDADATDGFSGLKYTRVGSKLVPNAGVPTEGQKFLWSEEHAGDTFDLGAGDTKADRYKKLTHNSSGAWIGNDSTTKTPTCVIDPDYLTGAEASSGTGSIWCKDFGGVAHEVTATDELWRLYIPSQTTADRDYRIGTFMFGHAEFFGHQYDRGWGTIRIHNVEIIEQPGGAMRGRKRGPSRREFTFGWGETAVQVQQAFKDFTADASPDYVAATDGGIPVATRADTIRMIEGLTDRVGGASGPVVLLRQVDFHAAGAGTTQDINDGRELVLGRVMTDPTMNSPYGKQSATEMERMDTITFREEK